MPKLMLNIEERIFLSAKELFNEKGYEQVNMKDISNRASIAVGTLYNYFSNKNDLYLSVLENSWNLTFKKLDKILDKDIDEKEKLETSVSLIYDEILYRRCMGIQVRKVKGLKADKSIENIERKIKKNIKMIFIDIKIKKQFEDDQNLLDKLVYTLLINLTMLIDLYPEDKEKNIEYLLKGLVVYFEQTI